MTSNQKITQFDAPVIEDQGRSNKRMNYFTANNKGLCITGPGAVLAVTTLILSIPFVIYPFGIANDFPNHYVAFSIAFEQLQGGLPHSFYDVQWRLFPHLAMASLAIPVAFGWDIPLAFHTFLVASVIMPVIGAWALHRQIYGMTSWSLILSLGLVYNLCLFLGFLDFNFSLGLALLLYALLLHQTRSPTFFGYIFLSIGTALLFLAHLLGFLIFGLLLFCHQIHIIGKTANFLKKIKTLVSPLLWLWPTAVMGIIWVASGPEPLPQENIGFSLPQPNLLLRAFIGPFYFGHTWSTVILLILFTVLLPYALYTGTLSIKRETFLGGGALLAATILLSQRVGGVALDFRLGMAMFLFAASVVKLSGLNSPQRKLVAVVSAFLLIGGLILQGFNSWQLIQSTHHEVNAIRNALHQLPPQSRLIAGSSRDSRKFLHTGSFIALDRDGFFPQIFQVVQPLRARLDFATINMPGAEMDGERLIAGAAEPPAKTKSDAWFNPQFHYGWPLRFDYLIWFSSSGAPMEKFPFLKKIEEGKHFHLFRIERQKATVKSTG